MNLASKLLSASYDHNVVLTRTAPESRKEPLMFRTARCFLMTICSLALAVPSVSAQPTPPMKPGLWQVHIEREENGQKMPDGAERMKEQMKNMSPEERQRFEEMMKQRDDEAARRCARRRRHDKVLLQPEDGGARRLGRSRRLQDRLQQPQRQFLEVAFLLPSPRVPGRWRSSFLRFREFRGQNLGSYDQCRQVPHLEFHENRNMAECRLWRCEADGLQAVIRIWASRTGKSSLLIDCSRSAPAWKSGFEQLPSQGLRPGSEGVPRCSLADRDPYQLQLRLARALDLLAQYDDLTTLSLDLGFSSHSHFSAAFRQAYGRSPSQFKRSALHD